MGFHPAFLFPNFRELLGDRLMAGRQILDLSIEVRPLVPQPNFFQKKFGRALEQQAMEH